MKNELTISKLLMMEMPSYRDQYRRIFTGADNQTHPWQFSNAVNALEGPEVSTDEMASLAGLVMKLSDTPEPSVEIPFGWDAPRYSFLLVVETKTAIGRKQTHHLAGYTDRIAPIGDLEFHINSISTWQEMADGNGGGHGQMLMNQSHLHSNPTGNGILTNGNYMELMRPKDMFARVQVSEVLGQMGEDMLDMRSRLTDLAQRSNRENVILSAWLAKVTEAYLSGLTDDVENEDRSNLWDTCRAHAEEISIGSLPVLRALAEADMSGYGFSQRFIFAQLEKLDHEVAEKTSIMKMAASDVTPKLVQSTAYEDWTGEEASARIAYAVALAVPALLTEATMSSAHFRVLYSPNDVSQLEANILTVSPIFANTDLKPEIDDFINAFETTVLPTLITEEDGIDTLFLEIDADLYGTSIISVGVGKPESINRYPKQVKRYVVPTFADALFSPIVAIEACNTTLNFADLTLLARDLEPSLSRLTVK